MYKICSGCYTQNELNELMCTRCFQRKFTYPSEINTTTVNKSYEESPHLTTLDQAKEVLKLKRNNEFLLEIKHNDVIGRESLLNEYIKDNLKISRFHCRFIFETEYYRTFIIDADKKIEIVKHTVDNLEYKEAGDIIGEKELADSTKIKVNYTLDPSGKFIKQ